ncbi:hypothetical protein HZ326_6654 [Fusarium oxysporum f. sp. albedinis]|nr:hypothetical protein HZ326_6654 [Fusarium oxysporum f. sp. albedinis]
MLPLIFSALLYSVSKAGTRGTTWCRCDRIHSRNLLDTNESPSFSAAHSGALGKTFIYGQLTPLTLGRGADCCRVGELHSGTATFTATNRVAFVFGYSDSR